MTLIFWDFFPIKSSHDIRQPHASSSFPVLAPAPGRPGRRVVPGHFAGPCPRRGRHRTRFCARRHERPGAPVRLPRQDGVSGFLGLLVRPVPGNEEGRLEEFCDNVYSWFLDYNEEFDDIDFNDNDKFPIPTSQASNDMFAIADGTIGLYFNKLKKGDRFTHEQVDYDNTKDIDKTVRISKIGGFDTYVIRPQDLYKDYKEYCEDRERKMQPETETKFYASKEYIGNTEPHNVKVSGKKVLCRILHRVVCKKGKCDCKCRIHYIPDKPEEEYEEESEEDHSEKVEKRTVKEKKRKFVVVDSDED